MIFFHHKLIIIVFIDQSFLIYGISMRGILNLIIPLQRGIYTRKSNQNIIFLNAWILPTCSFTVALSFNFGLLVILFMLDLLVILCMSDCWYFQVYHIASIFRYVRPYDSEGGWTICSPAAKCASNNCHDSGGQARVRQTTGKCRYDGKTHPAQS